MTNPFFMKQFLLLVAASVFLLYLPAKAQYTHYEQIIPADTSKNVLERLIYLSWHNNPDNQEKFDNAESFRYGRKKQSWEWLNQISVQGNLNEFSIAGGGGGSSLYFPRYNVGASIPLGIFLTSPAATKQAKALYHEALDKINSQKMDTRNKVTIAWETFRMYHRQMTIQQQINENSYADFLSNEKRFKSGKISLSMYNSSMMKYSDVLMQKIVLEKELAVSKSDLERLIGVRLEKVVSEDIIDAEGDVK